MKAILLKFRNIVVCCLWIVVLADWHNARFVEGAGGRSRGKKRKEVNCNQAGKISCDIKGLLSFHSKMSLSAQQVLDSWNNYDADPCHWQGVTCKIIKQKRRVSELQLDKLGQNLDVSTTIPPQLSQLRYLENLSLYNVGVTGTLPEVLSVLTNLRSFDIGSFGHGSLPPEYSKLTLMQSFHVDYGYLGGTLPAEYSTWSQIKSFGVYYQELRGSLPVEYSTWKQLIELYLGMNFIQGQLPLEYTELKSTETLDIAANSLSGEVPIEYSGISGTVYVYPQSGGLCVDQENVSLFVKETLATDLIDLPRC